MYPQRANHKALRAAARFFRNRLLRVGVISTKRTEEQEYQKKHRPPKIQIQMQPPAESKG